MYMKVVSGLNPELFAIQFNETCEHFKNPQVKFIDELTAYVYGEENTPRWEQDDDKTEDSRKRSKCAECSYYDWGRRCLKGNGYKRPGDDACGKLTNRILSEAEIDELKRALINKQKDKGAQNEKEIINNNRRKDN